VIPQWIDIRISISGFGIIASPIGCGSWVMLYNKVVPVQHPQRPIRSYPGLHRGHPFICTGKDVPAVNLLVSRAIRFYNGAVHQVPGWFAYKSYPVPILLGKLTGCIKMKACGSGKTTPYIYLA